MSGACRDEDKAASLRGAGVDAFTWSPDDGQGLGCVRSRVRRVRWLTAPPVAALMAWTRCAARHTWSPACHPSPTSTATRRVAARGGPTRTRAVLTRAACALALQVLATHQAQLLEASRPGGALRWLGYLSSTGALAPHSAAFARAGSRVLLPGVYGDHGGAWVDEDTPLRVTPAAGKPWLRAQAETTWRQLHAEHALPVHVFRLGGIYGKQRAFEQWRCIEADALCAGPGRSIIEARRGRADGGGSASQRSRGEKRYISRCHVADIVTALLASMDAPAPGCAHPACLSF